MPTCEGGYKTFKIGDLFTPSSGNTDIQKEHINGKGEYVISSGASNNGIIGRSDINAKVFPANTITIDMFGNVYYHPYAYKMVTHARVFSIAANGFTLTERVGLYLVSALGYLKQKFSYNDMCSWEKTKNLEIVLPTVKDGSIDFAFIEERVRELEAYLVAAGFSDCSLTLAECEALKNAMGGGNSL